MKSGDFIADKEERRGAVTPPLFDRAAQRHTTTFRFSLLSFR